MILVVAEIEETATLLGAPVRAFESLELFGTNENLACVGMDIIKCEHNFRTV